VHREVEALFAARTRDEWKAFNDDHDCCVEPVLGLDEALARADGMIVEVDQPGAGPVRLLGTPVKLSRTPPDPTRHGPPLGGDTDAVLAEAGFAPDEIGTLRETGAVA
jgi:alpha-methylacyl-CoA racemase